MPAEPASVQEARDKRAREIIEATMKNEPLMDQVQQSLAEHERGEMGITWDELEEKARDRHAG